MKRRALWRRNPWFWRAVIWMAALFALSSIPDQEGSGARAILLLPPRWHNAVHVPAYAVLAWLCWRALRAGGRVANSALPWAVGIAVLYGALDEVHQYFVPGRFLSLTDGGLNVVGAATAAAWIRWRDWSFDGRRTPPPRSSQD